ncbi:hypothetical protein ACTNED_09440 [Absicoccus porci]|uniref:hypothetical protein n=1 Tax=Absicoccus porci TaxID=2486576 RepID=UPI003F88D2D9
MVKAKYFLYYFGMSVIYDLAYFYIAAHATNYVPLVLLIGVLWSVGLYKLCMELWDIHRKIEWNEGLIVILVQFLFQFVLLVCLNISVKNDVAAIVLQVAYGLIVLLWMPVQIGVNYRLAKQKKPQKMGLWKGCTAYLIILVGLDTLTRNVYALTSLESVAKSMALANNTWFGWTMVTWMQMHFASAIGMALIVIVIYFVLSLFESGIWLYVVNQIGKENGFKRIKAHK